MGRVSVPNDAAGYKSGDNMSICRFSDNDYQCDLYVYHDTLGGITIHVAGNRVQYNKQLPTYVDMDNFSEWIKRHNIVSEMFDQSEKVKIDLPYADESFYGLSPQEAHSKVDELIRLGYNCPEYVLNELYCIAIYEDL